MTADFGGSRRTAYIIGDKIQNGRPDNKGRTLFL
jgi:hypothetical protein